MKKVSFSGPHSSVTLYQGDCLKILPRLGKVDAVITDPPYGINYVRGVRKDGIKRTRRFTSPVVGDDRAYDPSPWLCYPIVVLWGANYYATRLLDRACWLIWDKRNGIDSNLQADCELAWTNLRTAARLKSCYWNGAHAKERNERRTHPMQKPVALMVWCMEQTKVAIGATVLDPYMGSGTVGIACLRTKRDYIGIEIDPDHFDCAVQRLRKEACKGNFGL